MKFNFFRKEKPRIIVRTSDEYYSKNIHEFFSPTRAPEWFKSLKTLNPTSEEIMSSNKSVYGNARNCPAIIDIIKNTFSIKSPADFICKYENLSDGNFLYKWHSPWKLNLDAHNLEVQAGTDSVLNQYSINTKIITSFQMYANQKIRLLFLDPWLHTYSMLNIIPGVWELNSEFPGDVNVNYLIPRERIANGLTINIKKGDVLAYLYPLDFNPRDIEITTELVNQMENIPRYSYVNDYFKKNKS